MARPNPTVLLPLEMVCSARKHPLSSVSGRRRYNTLDFPTENRVPTGRFHPYWKPRINGICHPFEIPARLRICTHKQKKRVCDYRSINAKNPTVDPPKSRGKTVRFSLCRIHWKGSNSCVTHRCGSCDLAEYSPVFWRRDVKQQYPKHAPGIVVYIVVLDASIVVLAGPIVAFKAVFGHSSFMRSSGNPIERLSTRYIHYFRSLTAKINSAIVIALFTNSRAWCASIVIRFLPAP